MRHDVLMEMSKSDLNDYASLLGIDVTAKKTIAQKVEAIEGRRGRIAEVDVLGITLSIPVKRLHDKRVSDITGKPLTDEAASELLNLILGNEQMALLAERATDDDGTIDVEAMGLAMSRILSAETLKNF